MILDSIKVNNTSMMFYLKGKWYALEGQVTNTNLPEEKKDSNYEKQEWYKKLGISSEMDTNVVHRY